MVVSEQGYSKNPPAIITNNIVDMIISSVYQQGARWVLGYFRIHKGILEVLDTSKPSITLFPRDAMADHSNRLSKRAGFSLVVLLLNAVANGNAMRVFWPGEYLSRRSLRHFNPVLDQSGLLPTSKLIRQVRYMLIQLQHFSR